ncbi:hypothetical protein DFJ73DRAFT_798125 [Zopfochytrium polystomum]|nr:hypothetical protein DFJ73DRAFT_798125 [Zopfochytrium polystomum]
MTRMKRSVRNSADTTATRTNSSSAASRGGLTRLDPDPPLDDWSAPPTPVAAVTAAASQPRLLAGLPSTWEKFGGGVVVEEEEEDEDDDDDDDGEEDEGEDGEGRGDDTERAAAEGDDDGGDGDDGEPVAVGAGGGGDADDVVQDILRRHFEWDERRADLEGYLKRIKDAFATRNEAFIRMNLAGDEHARQRPEDREDEETRLKILNGLHKIRQLDSVLKEKNKIVKALRSTPPTATGTPAASADDNDEDALVDDDDDDAFELRSQHSTDHRTFVTETALRRRRRRRPLPTAANGGRLPLAAAGRRTDGTAVQEEGEDGRAEGGLAREHDTAPLKGYKKGDFIQRNIILGPNARYYHAMTEEEEHRVNDILNRVDVEEVDINDGESVTTEHSASSSSYRLPWLDRSEASALDALDEIDRKLVSMGSRCITARSSLLSAASSASITSSAAAAATAAAPSLRRTSAATSRSSVSTRDAATLLLLDSTDPSPHAPSTARPLRTGATTANADHDHHHDHDHDHDRDRSTAAAVGADDDFVRTLEADHARLSGIDEALARLRREAEEAEQVVFAAAAGSAARRSGGGADGGGAQEEEVEEEEGEGNGPGRTVQVAPREEIERLIASIRASM